MRREDWLHLPQGLDLIVTHQWRITMSNDPDPVFTFQRGPALKTPRRYNAREVRQEVFAISTPAQALAFFRKYGPWKIR